MKRPSKRDRYDDEADRYLGLPYTRVLVPDPDGGFVAEVLELPGCITHGDTPDEAYAELQDAMAGWIAASLAAGRTIPEPVGAKEYSGRLPLRISTTLHRAAALHAMREGISLNQWISLSIAEKVSGRGAASADQYQVSRRSKAKVADR
jgi:antitoxin HicB